jgi:hypothetical protein
MTIRKLQIENVIAFSAMAMIAFQVYWQYWFISLIGVWVVNPLLPIAMLAILALIFIWRDHRYPDLHVTTLATWIFLGLYLAWASVSILLHETTPAGAIHWLVDVWSPAAVFLVIHGMKNLRDGSTFDRGLKFLFVVAVLLSAYALFASAFQPDGLPAKPVLYWGAHRVNYFTGGVRLTIPGLGPNQYPTMLLPLIFLGLYWAQTATRNKTAFLVGSGALTFCVFATRTRAAFIPLICGFAYLCLVRYIRGRILIVSGCAIAVAILLNPAAVQRLRDLMPVFNDDGRRMLLEIVRNPQSASKIAEHRELLDHFILAANTVGLALMQPMLGIGMSRLADFQNSALQAFAGKSHNNFLSIAAGYGFPAMVFYFSFIASLALYLRRTISRSAVNSETWRSGHTWMAILITYALYLNGAPAEFHFVWLWFALGALWIRNCHHKAKLKKEETPAMAFTPAIF